MTFIIGTFQIHSKNERKQVKRSKDHMGDVQTVSFFYLQSGTLFKWLFKFISWYGLSQKRMITVPGKKCPSFDVIP